MFSAYGGSLGVSRLRRGQGAGRPADLPMSGEDARGFAGRGIETRLFDPADGFAPLENVVELTDSTLALRGGRW
jgi:hypothetical protein